MVVARCETFDTIFDSEFRISNKMNLSSRNENRHIDIYNFLCSCFAISIRLIFLLLLFESIRIRLIFLLLLFGWRSQVQYLRNYDSSIGRLIFVSTVWRTDGLFVSLLWAVSWNVNTWVKLVSNSKRAFVYDVLLIKFLHDLQNHGNNFKF